ncbi:MAG: CDGSH iron-sulfur domain-containing protein [Myxococcota bacterium]
MQKPTIADCKPKAVELVAGNRYCWCSCGLSAKQPFCDGSHKGKGFVPVVFTAQETAEVRLCMCKHSANSHLCDGTHARLNGTRANAAVPTTP